MRVEVEPRQATVVPGQATVLTVRVVNTGTVISGHRVRVLGVDPRWVHLDQDQLSLFPDAAGVSVMTVTLPPGIPAGLRRLGVEVQELTPPGGRQVVEVELTVPAQLSLKAELDPPSTTGGRSTAVGVVVDNTGNSEVNIELEGTDEEGQILFAFTPAVATLGPGERTLATAQLRAKRPVFGSPKIRSFNVLVGPDQPPVSAFGTWVQKPLLSRGAIALIGLALVISVFALILTLSLSKVVGTSNADRDLAIQVAQAGQAGAGGGGSGSIAGTVTLLTNATGVSGVTVEIFPASNTAQPLASVATMASGGYLFQGLAAGTYEIRFSGATFTQLWYPSSLTAANAGQLMLATGQALKGIDARLGGVPASLSGMVVGADPTGAMVSLEVPPPSSTTATSTTTVPGTGSPAPAIVTTQTVDASGAFTMTQIPSPSIYELVLAKQGYATVTQMVDLGSGQQRTGLVLTLIQGDGSITGQVMSGAGPVGGAAISASDGHNTFTSVSQTQGTVGGFVLSSLPTPDTFTLTITATGFAAQTVTINLAAAQQVTGVSVTLTAGVGSISGTTTLSATGAATGGVTVTVTSGQLSLQTVSLSMGAVGSYLVSGVPVPGTYTVTFSRPDLTSQTKAVTINAGTTTQTVSVALVSATAQLSGTVYVTSSASGPSSVACTPPPTGVTAIGSVAISLSSGTTSYQVSSASGSPIGQYAVDGVQPGTYTVTFSQAGGLPTSSIMTLTAGQVLSYCPVLAQAASITGYVFLAGQTGTPPPQANVEVQLFATAAYPGTPSQTTTTNSAGMFMFDNVAAPLSYILQFSYPANTAPQGTKDIPVVSLSQQYGAPGGPPDVQYVCPQTPGENNPLCEVSAP